MARDNYLFSGSSFGRAEQCAPFAALPWVDTTSRYAQEGTDTHGFLELVAAGVDRDAALALTPENVRGVCERIDVSQVPRGLVEPSMALDPRTGLARFTGTRRRRYDVRPYEIPMTPDVIVSDGVTDGDDLTRWLEGATFATVGDWKRTFYDRDTVYDEPQLAINCLSTAAITGLTTIGWFVGKINDDGGIDFINGEFNANDLAAIARRVRRAVAAVERERAKAAELGASYVPDVFGGHHCNYCPAFVSCPRTRATLRAVFEHGTEITERAAGAAYPMVQTVERWAEAAREVIKQYVKAHGDAETGDGRYVTLDGRGSLKLKRLKNAGE